MKLRDLPRNLWFTLAHSIKQKLALPLRRRRWRQLQHPITFKAARGTRFRLQPGQYIDSIIFTDGIYERRFLEYLARLIPRGGTMLDVGANIGNHALYLRDRFEAIHCFEPNPTTLELLRENIALNGVQNVAVHPVGLSSQHAFLPFIEDRDNLGVSHFVSAEKHGIPKLEVCIGDEVVGSHRIKNVRFIKIDVEGFEAEVVAGLKRTIARDRPLISFEFMGHDLASFEQIRRSLEGYSLMEARLEPGPVSSLRKIGFYIANASSPPLLTVESPEERYYPYILALPDKR
jgi:FkbM family methyltransferase